MSFCPTCGTLPDVEGTEVGSLHRCGAIILSASPHILDDIALGDVLARRYRLVERIEGPAWLAIDERLRERVVVKMATEETLPGYATEFKIGRAAGGCRGLRRSYDLCQGQHLCGGQYTILALEYVPGRALSELLPLDSASLPAVLVGMAEALQQLHAHGWTHNALTADNFVVDEDYSVTLVHYECCERGSEDVSRDIAALCAVAREAYGGRGGVPAVLDNPPAETYDLVAALRLVASALPQPPAGLFCARCERDARRLEMSAGVHLACGSFVLDLAAAQDAQRIAAGDVLREGKYRVLAAAGGEGVWEAVEIDDGVETPVALKELLAADAPDVRAAAVAMRHEADAGRFVHEHMHCRHVRAFEQDEGGAIFLVLDWVAGESLDALAPVAEHELAEVLADCADALQRFHDHGYEHRDVRPSNFVRTPGGVVVLVDYKSARPVDAYGDDRARYPPAPCSRYSAPETVKGMTTDARSDIYALGWMAYFLATGEQPPLRHDGRARELLRRSCPPEVARVVRRATRSMFFDRYGSAAAMSRDLRGESGSGSDSEGGY